MGRKRIYNTLEEKNKSLYVSLKKYLQKNPKQRLLNSCRSNAKTQEIEFSISKEDLIIPEKCPYLDIPFDWELGTGNKNNSPSVDRIDSNKGYISGNVEVVSNLANRMKNNATKEQLIQFSKAVLFRFAE